MSVASQSVWGVRTPRLWRSPGRSCASCGDGVARRSDRPSYLVITSARGCVGAEPGHVRHDVVQLGRHHRGEQPATIFNDPGQATIPAGDEGSGLRRTSPNAAHVQQLHHRHAVPRRVRRGPTATMSQGVDVPYAFDGAATTTVTGTPPRCAFHARPEPGEGRGAAQGAAAETDVLITTIAKVTFYGHDQTGAKSACSGNIEVTFGNFGDPSSSGG